MKIQWTIKCKAVLFVEKAVKDKGKAVGQAVEDQEAVQWHARSP